MTAHGMTGAARMAWLRLSSVDALLADEQASVRAQAWLGDAECQRLAAMGSPLRRQQFLAGHALARGMAAGQFGGEPAQWQWQVASQGRPYLQRGDRRVHLSLSHSGSRLACAISDEPIGLDLQVAGRVRDWRAVAAYVFSDTEQRYLATLPETEAATEFLALWTLKEARGKYLGEGLQVARARRFSATPTSGALSSHALTWSLEGCSLALVRAAGLTLQADDALASAPVRHWQFLVADAAQP